MKPVNEHDLYKTERLTHRESSERLLACLEGIDDDLIAEAAEAVSQSKLRSPIWKRFSLGSAAAVFIGAVAVSCVLFIAYWVSNIQPPEQSAHYEENGEHKDYPTPTPGELLPIPHIHASAFEVILPAGQEHMTLNNPWHDIGHIETLPVFRNHALWHFDRPMTSSFELMLSDVEMDEFLVMIHEAAKAIAMAADISPDGLASGFSNTGVYVLFSMDGGSLNYAHNQIGTLTLHTHLDFALGGERLYMPASASLANNATAEETQAAIEYLANRFGGAFPMEAPTITNAQGLLDVGGPMSYHRQRFFDSGGSPEDAILSFNFKWVEILTFNPNVPERIEMGLFPHEHFETLQLGNFPIITADEARQMLLDGYFISSFPDAQWPGGARASEASVELVYYSPSFSDVELVMPFYRFLIEVDMPLSHRDSLVEMASEHRSFIRYYVPAVHRDYLQPMTRRNIIEPPEPPTGHWALPPDIFAIVHGMDEDMWWSPLRVQRHDVAGLWDEVIGEIGELAVNESYQFRTACGHYALITGNRMFATREELHRYFPGYDWHWDGDTLTSTPRHPGYDLPETVGDFYLREISVFDQTENVMFISNSPMTSFGHGFMLYNEGRPAPVGEVFTRSPVVFSIFAMYEDSQGVQVGLGITLPIMGLHFLDPSDDPHTVLDMGEYGVVHFQGRPGEYFRALHEAVIQHQEQWRNATVELWFVNGSIGGRQHTWDLAHGTWHGGIPDEFTGTHWFTPVEREALEELVRIFNPAALFVEYVWDLMSLQ